MNFFKNFISHLNVNDKKIIYLIYFLPIAILAGSLVINVLILTISFLFLYEVISEK